MEGERRDAGEKVIVTLAEAGRALWKFRGTPLQRSRLPLSFFFLDLFNFYTDGWVF